MGLYFTANFFLQLEKCSLAAPRNTTKRKKERNLSFGNQTDKKNSHLFVVIGLDRAPHMRATLKNKFPVCFDCPIPSFNTKSKCLATSFFYHPLGRPYHYCLLAVFRFQRQYKRVPVQFCNRLVLPDPVHSVRYRSRHFWISGSFTKVFLCWPIFLCFLGFHVDENIRETHLFNCAFFRAQTFCLPSLFLC